MFGEKKHTHTTDNIWINVRETSAFGVRDLVGRVGAKAAVSIKDLTACFSLSPGVSKQSQIWNRNRAARWDRGTGLQQADWRMKSSRGSLNKPNRAHTLER